MQCSRVIWVGCCWAAGAWAGPLPLDQREVVEPQAGPPLVDVAPVDRPGPELLATAWWSDARLTQASDLPGVQADLPADGHHAAQADPVSIVAVAAVAADAEAPADVSRWISREWSSLPADHEALANTARPDEPPMEVSRPAAIALGVLVGGLVLAVLGRLWLRRRPATRRLTAEHNPYHRARLPRH